MIDINTLSHELPILIAGPTASGKSGLALEIAERQGVTYHNCGDWVESCTALVEDFNGQIRILRWVELDHLNQRSDDKVMPIRVGT